MKKIIKFIFLAVLLTSTGCISWDEGWMTKIQASGQGDVKQLSADAASLDAAADSADKIKDVINALEKITAIEPANFDALSRLGEYYFIYSYMYTKNKTERDEYYIKSIRYSERAMYTNPEFKKLADQGKPVWEAVNALTPREMTPMYWWWMSLGQHWNDQNPIKKLINYSWASRDKTVLERMTALQPEWNYGRIYMAWGCFYSVVPGFLGGDVKKSAENFDKAIQLGPDVLAHYVNRARYLHAKNGDKEAFKKDLELVLSKDIKKINDTYRWGAAYQMQARELLGKIDKLF
jgi:tetratricopeptide (TPR) repeat protein